ncbi:MAG: MauE/DoxX family redox-associated membrane protein [Bacteroidota bacterium]
MNRNNLSWLLRIILSFVFIFSAYSKLIAPGLIEIILVEQGFAASREQVTIYVRILIGLELALGLLFLQSNYLKQIVIPASVLFLALFTAYLFYTGFVLGEKDNCGCFGELLKLSPLESIIKNILFLIPALALFRITQEKKRSVLIPLLITIISIAAVFVLSPAGSAKDFKFAKYTSFEGSGRVDLSSGNKLLAVFNTECDHCQRAAEELYRLRENKNFPEMYILFFTEGNVSVDSFKTKSSSNFPYRIIDVNEFFNLIGQTPPRIYWLQNGAIKEKWDTGFLANINKAFSIY